MAHIQLLGLSEQKSPDNKIWKFPYAFPVIIKQLQKTKHTFAVLDTHLHKKTLQEAIECVRGSGADIYGISAFSHNYAMVKIIAQAIRDKNKDAVIIVGGLLAGNDDVLMSSTEVDIVVTAAEGEFVLPELLDVLDSGKDSLYEVGGITFKDKKSGKVAKTHARKVMSTGEYQSQGIPAYDYFSRQLSELVCNINSREDLPVKGFPLLTMRGCPFHCTFCGHLYGGNYLRKSWKGFFEEAELLVNSYGAKGFFSYDTNMFLNERDVDDYCNMYADRKQSFTMCAELRPTFGDYDMFKKLYDHGIRVILYGFESGSQYMLDRMQKGFDLKKMKAVIKSSVDAGMVIQGNFIFGTPGESPKTVSDTGKFMSLLDAWANQQKKIFKAQGKLCTSGYGWAYLIPSPTSELYKLAVGKKLISDEEEYLMHMGDTGAMELLKGSQFKIALAHMGGDVNMSEFSSKKALLCYIRFMLNRVKLFNCLFDPNITWEERSKIGRHLLEITFCYIKYLVALVSDALQGKRGFRG